MKIVTIVLIISVFVRCLHCVGKTFICGEGCQSCGKTQQKERKFVETTSFSEEELEATFGRRIEAGHLCSTCIRAVYHFRKDGKQTKVRYFTKKIIHLHCPYESTGSHRTVCNNADCIKKLSRFTKEIIFKNYGFISLQTNMRNKKTRHCNLGLPFCYIKHHCISTEFMVKLTKTTIQF